MNHRLENQRNYICWTSKPIAALVLISRSKLQVTGKVKVWSRWFTVSPISTVWFPILKSQRTARPWWLNKHTVTRSIETKVDARFGNSKFSVASFVSCVLFFELVSVNVKAWCTRIIHGHWIHVCLAIIWHYRYRCSHITDTLSHVRILIYTCRCM